MGNDSGKTISQELGSSSSVRKSTLKRLDAAASALNLTREELIEVLLDALELKNVNFIAVYYYQMWLSGYINSRKLNSLRILQSVTSTITGCMALAQFSHVRSDNDDYE